jgi:hypothetical protein
MLACVLLSCAVTGTAHAARKCFEDTIQKIHVGAIVAPYGNDGGMAIYFHTASGQMFPIDNGYNMNDSEGSAMFNLLSQSLTNKTRLTGYDVVDDTCNKISQLLLVN